ncbi:MAG: hypothetical protein CSA62_03515 [Planctomycetota bacterium]|nr:MAG: hypothetical protein CSA62_03515 [Planctomycetota bacterium]
MLGLCLVLLLFSCSESQELAELRLVRIFPAGGALYLNQRIDLLFDHPVDPSTVTEDSIRIVDEAGLPVPGELVAHSESLRVSFQPLSPVSPDLADGSFRPGRRYRLLLPTYPRSNSVRGGRGEILRSVPRAEWKAVDPQSLPLDLPTALMPSRQSGPLRLVREPQVEAQQGRIRLLFDRPLYPPSVRLSSFRLEAGLPGAEELPLRSASVLSEAPPGGQRGSQIELLAVRPLRPGFHTLWIAPGTRGPTDAALRPLALDVGSAPLAFRADSGRPISFSVAGGAEEPAILQRFSRSREALTEDPALLGLPGRIDGSLDWGPKGLRIPHSGFEGFRSLGTFVADRGSILQIGARIRTSRGEQRLPSGTWDFDHFEIPAGLRCYLLLDGALRIRVRGRLRIAGGLFLRYGSHVAHPPRPREALGDDSLTGPALTEFWQRFDPRLEVEVAGLARLVADQGRVQLEGQGKELVGFLRARGPLLGKWGDSALLPVPRAPGDFPARGPAVLGRLAAVSAWSGFADHLALSGRVRIDGPLREGLEILLQGQQPGPMGQLSAWLRPGRAPELGPVAELRFAVLAEISADTAAGPLLTELLIR